MASLVFIGDDFTGASDTLATLARRGVETELYLEPPASPTGRQAVGVATGLRAADPDTIATEIARLAPALSALAPRFLHYKICSTFDSSPEFGSIGAAVVGLRAAFTPSLTLVVGGQPSLGRYCLFGHLFAAASDGAVHRIDRHPVMSRHPSTPMNEADLARHLKRQGLDVSPIFYPEIAEGAESLSRRFRQAAHGAECLLLDVSRQSDLEIVGDALADFPDEPVLLVGASGVAEAVGAVLPSRATGGPAAAQGGSIFAFAGSRSSVTAAQVAGATRFHKMPLSPEVLCDPERRQEVAREAGLRATSEPVLAHLDPDAEYRMTPNGLAKLCAAFVCDVLSACPTIGALAVAGGDTSSMICQALGLRSLIWVEDLDPGVSLCRGRRDGGDVLLMLKGGQMGKPDLFDRFAARVERLRPSPCSPGG